MLRSEIGSLFERAYFVYIRKKLFVGKVKGQVEEGIEEEDAVLAYLEYLLPDPLSPGPAHRNHLRRWPHYHGLLP